MCEINKKYSEGLVFETNENKTFVKVKSIGTCLDESIIIPKILSTLI